MFFEETKTGNLFSSDASLGKDDQKGVEFVLKGLSDGRLAQRIMEVAWLAAAQHMLHEAHAMQSAVEAENSAQ
jgi:hypothetical protein